MSAVIPLSDLATIANNTVLGNISGGAAVPSALTGANVRTICGLATTDSPTFAGFLASGSAASVFGGVRNTLSTGYGELRIGNDVSATAGFLDMTGSAYGSGANILQIGTLVTGGTLEFYSGNGIRAFSFDASQTAHFYGALVTDYSLTTGAPAGGTAGAWKCGIKVTAASVFNTTGYIQLDVGGVLWKVALCV